MSLLMSYYCATVKVLIEDPDLSHASETLREAMNSLRSDGSIIDWGCSLSVPDNKGPHIRLVDPDAAAAYVANQDELNWPNSNKGSDGYEKLIELNYELFNKL